MTVGSSTRDTEAGGGAPPLLGFVHIQKTAGSTLKFVLRNSFGLRHCNIIPRCGMATDDDLAFAQRVHRLTLRCVSGHDLIGPASRLATPLQRFTFVRDPEARCVSHFLHRKRAKARHGQTYTFDEFLEHEEMWNRQTRIIAGGLDLDRAKRELEQYLFVGLTEEFDESLRIFAALSPYRIRLEYKRLHVTPNRDDRREVLDNPSALRRLREANELDAELVAWIRERLYPQLHKKASATSTFAQSTVVTRSRLTARYRLNRGFQLAVYRRCAKRRKSAS